MLAASSPSGRDNRELLEGFFGQPELARQRALFAPYLGKAIWWAAVQRSPRKRPPLTIYPQTARLWPDARLEDWPCRRQILTRAAARKHHTEPFQITCNRHRLVTYCVPLAVDGKTIGFIGLTHLRAGVIRGGVLNLLASNVHLILAKALRDYELKRLSESVRPRAIALSTVHTVHRLINSTLNLDELLGRLARLTSQVLRAQTCAIFLKNANRTRKLRIVERAKVGYPSKSLKRLRAFRPGDGLEGRVFATARFVLRKKLISIPLIDEDVIGVMTLTRKKDGKGFNVFDREILTTLAEEAVVAIKNAQLYGEQKRVTLGAIQSMAAILEERYTHSRRLPTGTLIKISLSMADALKCTEEEKQALHYATLLKDAGKIGLPEEIIKKPSALTGEEYRILREHPVKRVKIMQSFESLKPVAPILLYSHEHFDGSGYPQGLKGRDIPIGARILAVVSALDAILAGRPYKNRATLKEAVEELNRHKGSQFDPKVVDVFTRVINRRYIARLLAGI